MSSTVAQWVKPATRTDVIDQLVEGVDRYNPSNVEILEDYLYQQIRLGEYDCLANLAILKLYQFNPDLYNPDVVVNVLLKALTNTPSPDFNLCVALLGERSGANQTEEPDPLPNLLPQLSFLSNLLMTCRFPQFWETYRSPEFAHLRDNYTTEVTGFDDSIRKVVLRAVKGAFTKIGRSRLETYLNLKGSALEAYISPLKWTIDSASGNVVVPPNPDNQIQATVIREDIQLPQLAKIIAHAQPVA